MSITRNAERKATESGFGVVAKPQNRQSRDSGHKNLGRLLCETFSKASSSALSLVFPPQCAFCEVPLDVGDVGPQLCADCEQQHFTPGRQTCHRCGASESIRFEQSKSGDKKPQLETNKSTCLECKQREFVFDRVFSLGKYADEVQDAVVQMKYEPGQSLAMALGQRLGDLVGANESTLLPDLITCIPKFWIKRLVTGVNSSEMIMNGLGKRLGLATAHDLLVCRRKIKKQSLLSPDQRARNVKSAWSVNSDFDIRDAHVMIVDDTMTTGATANEAARVLKRAGCSHVSLAVVGRSTQLQ